MAQTKKVSGTATKVIKETGRISVRYHDTVVAQREGDIVTLNSGGWRTSTTKARMVQFANQFCEGKYTVSQRKGVWYVSLKNPDPSHTPYWGSEVEYYDGIRISL